MNVNTYNIQQCKNDVFYGVDQLVEYTFSMFVTVADKWRKITSVEHSFKYSADANTTIIIFLYCYAFGSFAKSLILQSMKTEIVHQHS